jgi:hypothetical protein
MNNRDEFSLPTKQALELRANSRCSFRGCPQITSGPSEESAESINRTGVAAHIHGAASGRGSRRYLASMTREDRRHISNGIWLCTTHADLIDGDATTYTADDLKKMKKEHEEKIRIIQRDRLATDQSIVDLIAVGETLFTGEVALIERNQWSVRVRHFVDGDTHSLIGLIDRFDQCVPSDRGLIVNTLGDGRVLAAPPALSTETDGGYILRCSILPRAQRISAAQLPMDIALGDSHDVFAKDAQPATVSGVEALPQKLRTVLSLERGESPFHPRFGARFSEYYANFGDSPWFAQLLKLELTRHAAIPYYDPVLKRAYTPLHCIERVVRVEALADAPTKNWFPIRVTLEVKGINGQWWRDLSIYISDKPVHRSSIDELLRGPGTLSSE